MIRNDSLPPLGPQAILDKKAKYLIPCSYHFYQRPPQIVRGSMQKLWDSDGREYLDFFAGVSVVACGHANPFIVEATCRQLATLQHLSSIYLTQPVVDLAERLAALMPGGIRRSFFCNSGSEANEGAFLLARLATGRRRVLSLARGLHGRTYLGMSATALPMWRTDPFLDPSFQIIPGPFDEKLRVCGEAQAAVSLEALRKELAKGDVAALIVEAIQGNGGIVPLPPDYLRQLRMETKAAGSLLIVDEVQTGFGRAGDYFAIQESGVSPDIISMAKALGNGVPIAAFAATDALAASFTKPSASTLGGNPVSCMTALAVLDYIESERLVERAKKLGSLVDAGLKQLCASHPLIAGSRGRGLMWGLELLTESGESNPSLTDRVLEEAKDRGLLVGKNGPDRNVIALQPPLVIGEADIDRALTILDQSLKAAKA